MKLLAILLLCTSCITAKPHIDALAGVRNFDGVHQWEQTAQQPTLGVQANLAGKDGFGPELGYMFSDSISKDGRYVNRPVFFTRSTVNELYGGVRKNFMLGERWQLFIGGGFSLVFLKTQAALTYAGTPADESLAITPYAHGGLNYFFNENVDVGLEYRRTFLGGNESIFINDPPTDSSVFLASIGYGF